MLRDIGTNPPIKSLKDFSRLYAVISCGVADDGKIEVAYRTLLAAQQGKRSLYLQERISLESLDWGSMVGGFPTFYRTDGTRCGGWCGLMADHLSTKALALAYEIEESNWNVIQPLYTNLERMTETLERWEWEIVDGAVPGKSENQSAFMAMMDYRIGHVIATGTKKDPFISQLIATEPLITEQAYAAQFAAYQQSLIGKALRRQQEKRTTTNKSDLALRL